MEKNISEYIDERKDELINLSKKIWENPEISFEEYNAAKWFGEFLEKEGFEVKIGDNIPKALESYDSKNLEKLDKIIRNQEIERRLFFS